MRERKKSGGCLLLSVTLQHRLPTLHMCLSRKEKNIKMPVALGDVIHLLLENYLTPGCAIRMMRCNQAFYDVVLSHATFWKYVAHDLELTFVSNTGVLRVLRKNPNRCKECGSKKGRPALLCNGKRMTSVCLQCAAEINGYNELVCRKQIFHNEGKIWSKKRRIVLAGLHHARNTRNNKHLYWGFEWRKPCRGRLL